MSETPDNVVAIETRFHEAPPVDWKGRDYLACQHKHTMLDEVLRTVGCRDCGEERLDPFNVLLYLAREWSSWHREAEKLQTLNREYHANRKATWERARDRHLGANPDHLTAAAGLAASSLAEPATGWNWTSTTAGNRPARLNRRRDRWSRG